MRKEKGSTRGKRQERPPRTPIARQALIVRFYHSWFLGKRRFLDSIGASRTVRLIRVIAEVGIVVQLLVVTTTSQTILWLLVLNVVLAFAFAVASILAEWLPRREVRPKVLDVHYVRELQAKLRNLLDELRLHSTSLECVELLGEAFSQQAFESACRAICGHESIRVSYMIEDDNHRLRPSIVYPTAPGYESSTHIRLAADGEGYKLPIGDLGVGGFAHGLCKSVYVPRVSNQAAYFVDAGIDGSVSHIWLGRAWLPSDSRRYKSVISVPVYVREGGANRPLGVLNFESSRYDAFGSADFHIACLLAGLYALGLHATMQAVERAVSLEF
ncbi:hypothetical protein ACFLSZ_00520 [Candidatus Bipolaricaulota bacterium]